MIELARVVEALEGIAPTANAEEWDNVGLLVGDATQQVNRVILTIDYTPAVAGEAQRAGCDLVIAYHPPIFTALKSITAARENLIFDAIRRGIAIYSPHTALDVADGGTNDMLADAIGLTDRRPLRLIQPKSNQLKLVTFVPEKDFQSVSEALFAAGAGRIGNYTHCSFRSPGTGTFFGEENTNPTIGRSGRLEEAPELRIETVVPISKVHDVVTALRKSHPYEEPAFDLQQLAAPPTGIGQGRLGKMQPTQRQEIFERIKRELGIAHLLIAGPTTGTITTAACCAGACGEFVNDAIAARAELYLTGEIRHHDALKAASAGMTIVCTLHSNSERAVLKRLAKNLAERLADLPTIISAADRDPFALL
jgi:dinuclear metal center YbgI/SA1388 family protein